MVWVCMAAKGPGPIYVDGYDNAKPYMNEHNMPICSIYQHDKAKTVRDKIQELGLEVMPWPFQSPYVNPIENAWKYLKARVSTKKSTNEAKLWQVIEKK